MNKNKKIIIAILIVLIIAIGIVVAYKVIENSVTNREDFNFTVDYTSSYIKEKNENILMATVNVYEKYLKQRAREILNRYKDLKLNGDFI